MTTGCASGVTTTVSAERRFDVGRKNRAAQDAARSDLLALRRGIQRGSLRLEDHLDQPVRADERGHVEDDANVGVRAVDGRGSRTAVPDDVPGE